MEDNHVLIEADLGKLQNCKDPGGLPDVDDDRSIPERRYSQLTAKITHLIIDIPWRIARAIDVVEVRNRLGGPNFPNLLSLVHSIDGAEDPYDLDGIAADAERWTPLLPLLIGPGIEKLTLTFYNVTKQVVEDNIQSLIHIAPRALSIDYSAFSQIRSLTVRGFIDHQTWRPLASWSRLESIVLEDDIGRDVETQNYSVTFLHVKTLSIDHLKAHGDAELTLALLRGATMPAL
ncbi:hypothetical protein FRB94_002352 [Tulasnella sp. JGI-2019a]|nr:hypothetical protein FRB94_002352 [Tulasnella sp. JGI-2019a]